VNDCAGTGSRQNVHRTNEAPATAGSIAAPLVINRETSCLFVE